MTLRLSDSYQWEHTLEKKLLKNRFKKVELLEMEGCQMSSATLSQLTNKGMKSQDPMVIFIYFLGNTEITQLVTFILYSHQFISTHIFKQKTLDSL